MKLNSFNGTTLNKIKNIKLVKRGAALVMAGVTLVTLSSCSKETKRNTQNESSSIVAEINNEYIGDEKTTNNAQLPSFYNCFNIFEDSEIDKKYGVAYLEFADENVNFVDKLLNHKVSTEELKKAFDELNNDPTLANENFNVSYGNAEILEYDKSNILLKYKNKESYAYALIQLKGDKGYLVAFNQIELKSYCNSNCLIFYSNNDQKIITYNKLTGDLVILENTVCLGCDNDIISLARCDDKESIYRYDAKNGLSEKEKVNNLTIQKNYVSYNKDNMFNAVDLLNVQKYTKDLGKENFWIKLSDGSIVYVTKDGVQKRYQRYYNLEEGDFNKDYCILSNLSTYPDENGYSYYSNSFYFNKNLDSIYELPYYNKMLDNNIVKGYIKYLQNNGSDCFVDLTTGKTYYITDTVLSNEYTIYHALGASNNNSNCSIFKDGQGKTVFEVNGEVQKYFDEEKIAIKSYWTNDDKSVYYVPTIIDLSDFNNPKVILTSMNPNSFTLVETPINTIFKVYWSDENKFSLIDIMGNELTDKVDFIQFDTCGENDEIVYAATLGEFREKGKIEYTSISFNKNGKTIDEMSSHKLIKQR